MRFMVSSSSFRSSTSWPFHLSSTKDMQVEMINRLTWTEWDHRLLNKQSITQLWKEGDDRNYAGILTCLWTVVDNHTKPIKNAFYLGNYFCSMEKLTQYFNMPKFSLQRQNAQIKRERFLFCIMLREFHSKILIGKSTWHSKNED